MIKKLILILIGSIPGILLIINNNIKAAIIYFIAYLILVILLLILTKKKNRVLFISSTGGHLEELMELKPLFNNYRYYLVTEKTDTNIKLKNKYKGRVSFLIYGTKVHKLMYIFKVFLNGLKSIYLFFKIRPKYIVTTGTHTAIPICTFSKLFGTKVIYIETFANSNTRTMTGNFLYKLHIYNLFIVQWEDMLKLYPKAVYGGWIFN